MVNLSNLLAKYDYFSNVEDDIFVYIDRILENVCEVRRRQKQAEIELALLEEQITKEHKKGSMPGFGSPKSPTKKRKVQSLDTSARKENLSILEHSALFGNKSDPDTSLLDRNIVDSEEPLFGLSQSPPRRGALTVKNESSSKPSPVHSPTIDCSEVKKSSKSMIRSSRFSKSFVTSNLMDSKSDVSPPSNGKWTIKKPKSERQSPKFDHTPVGLKRFHSLVDRHNGFRQTKLNFAERHKGTSIEEPECVVNETLLNDFVIPTPSSIANKSKLLKSLRMRKQSTIISGHRNCEMHKSTSATKGQTNTDAENHRLAADSDDINQTFCPGVDSCNKQSNVLSVKIKQEPLSEHIPQLDLPTACKSDYLPNPTRENNEYADMSEVILLPGTSQPTVISVGESQNENEIFLACLNAESTKRLDTTNFEITPPPTANVKGIKPYEGSCAITKPKRIITAQLPLSLCTDCGKLYNFHMTRGFTNDMARSKLPRNCRNCRMVQLHNTPPGFWNPDFLPTQK